MATITFDTHDFVIKMREAGFDEKQAEAIVRVVTGNSGDIIRVRPGDLNEDGPDGLGA